MTSKSPHSFKPLSASRRSTFQVIFSTKFGMETISKTLLLRGIKYTTDAKWSDAVNEAEYLAGCSRPLVISVLNGSFSIRVTQHLSLKLLQRSSLCLLYVLTGVVCHFYADNGGIFNSFVTQK
jgi:hypothetical protein